MNRKKATSLIAIILVLLMVISLVASIIPATAYAVSQRDLEQIQQEKAQLSSRVQECQSRIDKLKEEQSNVLEQKLALDEQNRCANEQLALVAEEISIYNGMIEEKTKELEDAKEREETQLKRYRARVRAMEENGGYNILALIVNSGSFGEFLTAMDDMGEIMESDKTLERQYVAAREETEAVKAEYEEVREDYEEKHSQLKAEQAQLEKQIEDAYAALASLEEEIEEAIAEYKAAEAEEQAAAAAIRNIIAQINEQHRQEAANNGGADAGGSSSGGGTTTPDPEPSKVDLAAFCTTVTTNYSLPHLSLADSTMLDNYYAGLSSVATEQSQVYINMMSMNMGEISLVQVKDSKDVATVKAVFQARIDSMVNGGAWYPEPTRIWSEQSRVVSNGNYVMMVVGEDCDSIVKDFNALF